MHKNGFRSKFLIFLSSLFFSAATVHASTLKGDGACVLLGSSSSFIVKFKNKHSNFKSENQISPGFLRKINPPGISFISARPMAGGNYILTFKNQFINGQSASLLKELRPNCYTQESMEQFLEDFSKQPEIEHVAPNKMSHPGSISNFSYEKPIVEDLQWNLLAPPGGIDIENAWYNSKNTGKPHIIVAVLDTGILPNASLGPNALPGVHFVDNGSYGLGAQPSCDEIECPVAPHGTHVGGIIAASARFAYGEYIYGVAPTSKIVPVNVFTKKVTVQDCEPSPVPCLTALDADIINALSWVIGEFQPAPLPPPPKRIVAVNMSLGGPGACTTPTQKALNKVYAKGVNVIVSAMNDNVNTAGINPANCKGVIAVAATGPSGERATYSNWGSTVTVAAPGGNSTNPYYPAPANEIFSTVQNGYAFLEGTSMAAPTVTGLISLLYAIDPYLTPTKIKSILRNKAALTAFPSQAKMPPGEHSCVDPAYPARTCGMGIINANKAVTLIRKRLKEQES